MVTVISNIYESLKNHGIGPGVIVVSTAGHDKGRTYLIIDCKEKIASAVNGFNRGIDYPKMKRVKHLKMLCSIDRREYNFEKIAAASNIGEKNAVIRKIINDSINQSEKERGFECQKKM